ncbi:MAG: peptide chain release factor N(5)-glutamine methyltransferase [Elusimicrobiota bacterium]
MKTVLELVNQGTEYLANKNISEPELSSQWLLSHVLGRKRLDLLSEPAAIVSEQQDLTYRKLLNLRAKNLPISYITGTHNFMGIEISIGPGVFIPRPETEELVEKTLEYCFKTGKKNLKIMDFGTGSGCIGIALALKTRGSHITAVDISDRALKTARKNAEKYGLLKGMRFLKSSRISEVPGRFDIIVSNPPYIPSRVIRGLDPEVRAEPRTALDAGKDGLKIIRQIIAESLLKLRPGGTLWLEIGADMKENIKPLFSEKLLRGLPAKAVWQEVEFLKDYNNKYRFVRGQVYG